MEEPEIAISNDAGPGSTAKTMEDRSSIVQIHIINRELSSVNNKADIEKNKQLKCLVELKTAHNAGSDHSKTNTTYKV